ncbi:MAG: RiPP maturation radical SAM protein 1 [bacterium]|nr:RiPP maturation radical SAM protein 1 [bacterium]
MRLEQDIVQTEAATPRPKVALVFMPFAMRDTPSIQLGLLSELARNVGYHADCFHLNLELAARLPEGTYEAFWTHENFFAFGEHMTGEWLFSVAAFGDAVDGNDAAYFEAFPRVVGMAKDRDNASAHLSSLRHELLPRFIEDCVDLVPWSEYDVVGFSSSYQQNVASIALARRIKKRWPRIKIAFGGPNLAGEMGPEYARAFSFIDYIVVGEADQTFPDLLKALEEGNESPDLPGLVSRADGELKVRGTAPPFQELDQLPTPNYDEYFERYKILGFPPFKKSIVCEGSRGCWWGEKQHCTFCSLNGVGIKFRKKSVPRILAEIAAMSGKYGVTAFQMADNIMDMGYINSLFREIEQRRYGYSFFYDVKSNLRKDQIRQLSAGGVRWLEAGIESMNSHVLQLMRKGCTMLHNVRLLKWARYYQIRVAWNVLWGFPGETDRDYVDEYRALRLLFHLEPPNFCRRVWMDRFSPIFEDRNSFPAKKRSPERSYGFVYPDHVDLEKIAYFFDYELERTTSPDVHIDTEKLIEEWRSGWFSGQQQRPRMVFRRTQDHLFVDDSRSAELNGTYAFSSEFAAAYEFCSDTMRSAAQVAAHVNRELGGKSLLNASDSDEILAEFCDRGLMLSDKGKYLSLALPANPNW